MPNIYWISGKRGTNSFITTRSKDVYKRQGLRGQSRPCGAYVDDAVQGRRTIEHAGGSFDDLYLLHIVQRYAVPVDDSVWGAEHAHPVYQYQAAGTYAAVSYTHLLDGCQDELQRRADGETPYQQI